MTGDISSPCIKVCRLRKGVCIGCKRTAEEIRQWFTADDETKISILKKSQNRMSYIPVKKLHPDAKIPTRGSEFAAGVDLYSIETVEIPPQGKAMIATGIAVSVPANTYLRIAPRSGLAAKHGIDVLAGVVDSDYRGEIKVILINHGVDNFVVNKHDRIAQAIVEVIQLAEFTEVEVLSGTVRGAGGFGSTGV